MKTRTIKVTSPKAIEKIKEMVLRKEYISKMIRDGKVDEIDKKIKFAKPLKNKKIK